MAGLSHWSFQSEAAQFSTWMFSYLALCADHRSVFLYQEREGVSNPSGDTRNWSLLCLPLSPWSPLIPWKSQGLQRWKGSRRSTSTDSSLWRRCSRATEDTGASPGPERVDVRFPLAAFRQCLLGKANYFLIQRVSPALYCLQFYRH